MHWFGKVNFAFFEQEADPDSVMSGRVLHQIATAMTKWVSCAIQNLSAVG